MANRIAVEPALVRPRKGKQGNVVLSVSITPQLKRALVAKARREDTTLAQQVRTALFTWVLR